MRLVPERSHAPEIMDRPDNSFEDLDTTLRNIRTINRLLGGRRAILAALRPHLSAAGTDAPLELLDVGTGGADLPLAMVALARQLGRELRVTAIDRDRHTAAIAERECADEPAIRILRADAFDLPFARESFDLVTCSLFLHHFRHDDVVRLLSGFRELARSAVLVNDLRRHRVPWGFISVVTRLFGMHAMVRHDGPLSVLRGFTPAELERAGREAGQVHARVVRRWPYRVVMALDGAAR